ncbi:zinc-finger domain-containing protein [Candidatus Phycosocius spiralis]|nr:zinc-finger domain-containing protein [Candidatus Phycosocius spiralis]
MSKPKPAQFPIPIETMYVQSHRIACDGGEGALGHPKVWYEMGDDGKVECLYCGRIYVHQSAH